MVGFAELLQRNSTDPKVRLEVGQQLLDVVRAGDMPLDATALTGFMDVMVQWLNGTNFKVALLALEILSGALDAYGGSVVGLLLDNAVTVMERLGDSREQVRQFAMELLLKMMNVPPASGPQAVWDRIADGLLHKQWLVRVGVMVILQQVLRTLGHTCLQLAKIVPLVCRLLADPMNQVRDVATETLVDMYICVGDKLSADIQRKQLVPQARAAALFSRFDDIKRNGPVSLPRNNGYSSANGIFLPGGLDGTDRAGHQSEPVGPKKAPAAPNMMFKSPALLSVAASQKRATSAPPVKRIQTSSRYTGSAGAVDEDSFYAAFEDVPKIELFASKDVVAYMQQIRGTVINPNCDWDKRVEALKQIRSLLLSGAHRHEEFYQELRSLEVPMQLACKDLRSQVVREACITVAFLADQLGAKLDHFAELILPVLISLIQNSAKVIATSALVACRFVINNTRTAKIVSVIVDSCASKSREIRRACYEMVATVCQQWSAAELEKSEGTLQKTIRQGLADADPDARVASRRAYWSYSDNFRESAEALFQSLDPGKKRSLLGEVSQSSSSHSLFNALLTAQDAVPKSSLPVYMNNYRMSPCVRSTSEIDPGAVRRAALRQASVLKMTAPLGSTTNHSLHTSRPTKFNTAASSSGYGRSGNPSGAAPLRQDSTPAGSGSAESPSSNSKSLSQPGSRSSSPNSRSAAATPASFSRSRFGGPVRSHASSRDNSPIRTPRRLSTPDRVVGRSFYDSDFSYAVASSRSGRKMEDIGSESSSMCSERSFRGYDRCDVMDILRSCSSSVWSERKEALLTLQTLFKSCRRFSKAEVKKTCDVFSRLFVDPHHKTFAVFLETLIEFVRAYHGELNDWLYMLLCRLLAKQSTELLPSVQNKMQRALETVRELFPTNAQFDALVHYLVDPVQTPNIKMKLNLLGYMVEVSHIMETSGLTNSAEVQAALSRVVQWTGEPKSPEVRRAAQNALVALFNLNAPEFSRIVGTFSKAYQDTVYRILNAQVRHVPDVSSLKISTTQGDRSMTSSELDYVHASLKKTSKEIQSYPFSDYNAIGSNDSGIVDVVDNFLRNGSHGGGGGHGLLNNGNTDEDRQEEIVSDILTELSNHNQRSVERRQAMATLKYMTRDGSFTRWDDHFKSILLILLETLGDDDSQIRACALPVLKEICIHQSHRFQDYAELTILRLLEAHKDSEREVTRAAEDCASVVATHLPPLVCLRVLIPVIRNDSGPALLAAIKMTTKVVENMDADDLANTLPELVPGILMGFENPDESSVRKASVLCLVALHSKLSSETLEPFLVSLSTSKRKLLNLYIKRDQQQ